MLMPMLGLLSAHAVELAVYVPSGGKAAANPIAAEATAANVSASPIDNIAPSPAQANSLGSGLAGPVRESCGPWKFDSGAWLFANCQSDADALSPSPERKYFAFALKATSTAKLKLDKLCFEYAVGQNTDVSALSGNFYYAVFASVNGAPFVQIDKTFISGQILLIPNTSTLFGTQTIQLSGFKNVERVEFRIWVGSSLNNTQAGSQFQNIVVHGSTPP